MAFFWGPLLARPSLKCGKYMRVTNEDLTWTIIFTGLILTVIVLVINVLDTIQQKYRRVRRQRKMDYLAEDRLLLEENDEEGLVTHC